MNIKIDQVRSFKGNGPIKDFCDVIIEDAFMVKGLKIVEGKEGTFVGMPSEQGRDGKWYETFHPVSKELRKGLQEAVLEQYANNEA